MSEFNPDWQRGYEEGISVGKDSEMNHILRLLEVEQARTKLGFIQYETIQKLLGNKEELS